jgi:hypothetical protein
MTADGSLPSTEVVLVPRTDEDTVPIRVELNRLAVDAVTALAEAAGTAIAPL